MKHSLVKIAGALALASALPAFGAAPGFAGNVRFETTGQDLANLDQIEIL